MWRGTQTVQDQYLGAARQFDGFAWDAFAVGIVREFFPLLRSVKIRPSVLSSTVREQCRLNGALWQFQGRSASR